MKKYKYILICNDDGQRLELTSNPVGWDETKFNIIRDLTYIGVFKSLSIELEFVSEGYSFLQSKRLLFGIDADVIIRIYERNKFRFDGKINYENFKEDRKFNRFKVDILESSFVQDFKNRDEVDLNILNDISLNQTAITPANPVTSLIRGKTIAYNSVFYGSAIGDAQIYHHVLPFKVKFNGNPQVKEVIASESDYDVDSLKIPDDGFYVNTSGQSQNVHVEFDFGYFGQRTVPIVGIGSYAQLKLVYRLDLIDGRDNSFVSNHFIKETTYTLNPSTYLGSLNNVDHTVLDITVPDDHYLLFWCERRGGFGFPVIGLIDMEGSFELSVSYPTMNLTINENSVIDDTNHQVILPHELFSNLIAQITGLENSFYSDYFGRTDLGYEVDGEGALIAIIKGYWLRLGETDQLNELATSFKDAFKSYNVIRNLGVLIEDKRIRIEPKNDLFNGNISVDLGEVSDLSLSPAKDFIFNSVKAGYPKVEYEQDNGRDEFNTEVQYTNSIRSIKKELDLVSKYRADGYGIEFARRLPISTSGDKDSRYDDIIFLIDLVRYEGGLQSRRLEGIDLATGILSPETAFNLRISPGQNLLYWENYLNIPLWRKSTVYFFQTKDKNNSLRVITSVGESVDQQDLELGSSRLFLPEGKEFNSPITFDKLFAILANPLGIITYTYKGDRYYDYLSEVDAEGEKKTATWKVLSTRPSPSNIDENPILLDALKYGDGSNDFVKYGDGSDDYILYQ